MIARARQHPASPPTREAIPPGEPEEEPDTALAIDALVRGVLEGDRALLARAISLVESTSPVHQPQAERLLERLHPHAGKSVRLGITGVPGAGKSTLIERLGLLLCEAQRRVAVLAVDPSSTVTGGSILGDRTRMTRLSTHPRAFIRPSPSGRELGGVARRTREVILLCEAAGFDTILVETVGVGQSESAVADMTDCFLALAIPGAGDELQGIKRGMLELADVIAVNKADGDNIPRAKLAAHELAAAVRTAGRGPVPVLTCSAATGAGLTGEGGLWPTIEAALAAARASGAFDARRQEQSVRWLASLVAEEWRRVLDTSAAARAALERAGQRVRRGALPSPTLARTIVRTAAAAFAHDQPPTPSEESP